MLRKLIYLCPSHSAISPPPPEHHLKSDENIWTHLGQTDTTNLIFCLNLRKIDGLEATQVSKEHLQDIYRSGALWPARTRCWWWSRLLPEGHSSGSFSGLRRRDATKIKQRSCNVAHQRAKITFTQIGHPRHVFNCCAVNYNKIIKQLMSCWYYVSLSNDI